MDLILDRAKKFSYGVFSELTTVDGKKSCAALEHAYLQADEDTYEPKLPPGNYKCVRGLHRLANMHSDFETFEVTGVEGHTGILFHPGNFNKDSEGCILLGLAAMPIHDGTAMLTESRIAFSQFMLVQENVYEFNLEVRG